MPFQEENPTVSRSSTYSRSSLPLQRLSQPSQHGVRQALHKSSHSTLRYRYDVRPTRCTSNHLTSGWTGLNLHSISSFSVDTNFMTRSFQTIGIHHSDSTKSVIPKSFRGRSLSKDLRISLVNQFSQVGGKLRTGLET